MPRSHRLEKLHLEEITLRNPFKRNKINLMRTGGRNTTSMENFFQGQKISFIPLFILCERFMPADESRIS
ncbi:MAG: hypothetical protein COS92_03790 [Desulfobacterales bacterium CG07_land_8_20_14_0_80_52_14]|nr:MAG: hypothetical protein COS92_03790 [Desulfobacterales bacterium CG07_land_8_20_14_0_80_52_14]